ncbi:MAG: HPr family phosphocarrier protein [Anaeromyxobacter sp.]|nr:HPr family phosphocarrier protein [Anaeromyxobacter sp.]MBL0278152.1 HPr family phosphocarrier protein [Anaeromyxobacter sp.]
MSRLQKTFTIVNPLGLHARPAAQLVQAANRHKSEVLFAKDGAEVNAKSIMGVLTLAAARGSQLTVTVEGEDAETALAAIGKMIETGFGEG